MTSIYQRQAVGYRNELKTSCAALVGLVQGVMADEHLSDSEIVFLGDWLKGATTVSEMWPGSLIADQVREILSDGVVTTEERARLMETLKQLVGGRLDEVADAGYVSELPLDRVESVEMSGKGMDISGFSQLQLNAIARQLNERPRKTLGFHTPAEMFSESVASTG